MFVQKSSLLCAFSFIYVLVIDVSVKTLSKLYPHTFFLTLDKFEGPRTDVRAIKEIGIRNKK